MISINIKSNEKNYPIYINDNEIKSLRTEILKHTRGTKILVVISEKVQKLYGKELGFNKAETFVLKDGEREKNFKNYEKLLKKIFSNKLTRTDAIIAIGGGVAGDLAGFAAATYMRGIDFIQVPTTLLACIDSSVGGKTAINTSFGKNLLGCFYQPSAVFINTNFLKTLDERQFKTGLGEAVKYVFIEQSCKSSEEIGLPNFLTNNTQHILNREPHVLKTLIEKCILLKKSVVEKDEKELGLRKILNFGHTYAHAVEKYTNYKQYTHGETVVKGILFAFKLAEKKNLIDKDYHFYAKDLLEKFHFKEVKDFPIKNLLSIMKLDKKNNSDKITFILPTRFAEAEEFTITDEELLSL